MDYKNTEHEQIPTHQQSSVPIHRWEHAAEYMPNADVKIDPMFKHKWGHLEGHMHNADQMPDPMYKHRWGHLEGHMHKSDPMYRHESEHMAAWEAEPVHMRKPMAPPPVITLPAGEKKCGFCITLAMSYTPMQKWGNIYETEKGFERGTIFAELDLPFEGKGNRGND